MLPEWLALLGHSRHIQQTGGRHGGEARPCDASVHKYASFIPTFQDTSRTDASQGGFPHRKGAMPSRRRPLPDASAPARLNAERPQPRTALARLEYRYRNSS